MIKPSELRCGNYVSINGIKHTIVSINKYRYEALNNKQTTCNHDELEPIPLTSDWLLKFGLKPNSDSSIFFLCEPQESYEKFTVRDYSGFQIFYGDSPIMSIEYVHQLQNLYHSLTGEELTIKE